MLIMAANMDNSSYQLVARWLAGNIWGTSWHQVLALLPYMLILVPFLLTKSNILDILLLGENTAISLGIAVERELRLLLIASVALTSACVAVSGGIGFVGLVAPHMARRLIGGRHHALMPASMLLGALLWVAAGVGAIGAELWGGALKIAGFTLHPLVLLYALSGSLMISRIRIPKL